MMMMMMTLRDGIFFALMPYEKYGAFQHVRDKWCLRVVEMTGGRHRTTQSSAHNVLHDRRTAVAVNTSNECLIVQWHYCLAGQGHKPSSNDLSFIFHEHNRPSRIRAIHRNPSWPYIYLYARQSLSQEYNAVHYRGYVGDAKNAGVENAAG